MCLYNKKYEKGRKIIKWVFFTEERVFGDRVYCLDETSDFVRNHEANKIAEKWRKDGHLARVVERRGKGYYCVYVYKRPGYKKTWKKKKV